MTLKVWATQNAVDTTGTGTTDFTHGTVTNTPTAALHCFSNGQTNGSAVNQGRMAFGFTDGTDERFASIGSQHNVATSNTVYRRGTTACVESCFTTGSAADGSMSHNSFIAGGQRLNNDNAFGNPCQVNSLFFDCDNAKVMSATLNATQDVKVTIDPGFAWDCVFFIGCPTTIAQGDGAEIYFGFFDGTNQGGIMFNSADADASPGDPVMRISNTRVGGELNTGASSLDYGIEATVGLANNELDLWPRDGGGDTDPVYCLFLGWGTNESVSVVSWDAPTATPPASNQVTSVGFQPQACVHLLSFAASYDISELDIDAGSFGVSFETADEQYCQSIQDEDNTGGNTDTQSMCDIKSINVPQDDGSTGYEADLTNYLSNGWDHNFTVNAETGAANKFISIAFEEEAAAGSVLGGSNRGVARGVMRGVG